MQISADSVGKKHQVMDASIVLPISMSKLVILQNAFFVGQHHMVSHVPTMMARQSLGMQRDSMFMVMAQRNAFGVVLQTKDLDVHTPLMESTIFNF